MSLCLWYPKPVVCLFVCLFLCLHIFIFQSLMYNEGDITRTVDLADPTSGRFSQLVWRVSSLITRSPTPDIMAEQCVIVTAMLKVINHTPFYFIIF